ncbi:unnamed protein product [Schistosoma margrebowiei]|uniref:Uncharacterized protein n=1 Tax=Schistosoma margrebowiei TaxID=48269 RepID=A0A183LXJ1_9TREM|nr:unnamed protein product [Schistosoma margrebowiei]
METLDKVQERKNRKTAINNSGTRTEKANAHGEYLKLNKRVERSIIADKQKFVEDEAMTVEKATREGNVQQLCDTTKKLVGKQSKVERPVKDKEGEPINH